MFYGEGTSAIYVTEIMGGGCAFFDYDNDGWMDIFILGGRRLESVPPGASKRLYKNNRDGTFTDVTEKAGLLDAGWAVGFCVGDYNNDGFEDLFVTYFGQNRLYRNNGDGTFTDVAAKAGLLYPSTRFGSGCIFVDYNRDGLLDLFVSNYCDIDLAMFSVFGVILTVYGFMSDRAIYVRPLGININLVWGLTLLAFGASMLLLGMRRGRFLK